jgi:hypothetical protein
MKEISLTIILPPLQDVELFEKPETGYLKNPTVSS